MAVSSNDGVSWTVVTYTTFGTSDIYAITYDNGKFIAGGLSGKMATSTDGTTWTAVSDTTLESLVEIRAIAYGNGKWVAVGGNGRMAYSSGN